ncbi:MAG: efflux RND transporter periplasmic adaptor subunit [Kiritimatiellae bacterium]|nr:efflux RND transporter periplasmic adaptor subunit [Kiritimatiellia bacterium]
MGIFQKTAAGDLPLTTQERRLKQRRILKYGLTAAIGIILIGFAIRVNQYVPASGYVTTEHYAEVRSPVVGLISNILVQSGTRVKQGDLLAQLSCAEEAASLEEARNQAQKAEAELKQRESQISEQKRRLSEDIAVANLRLQNAMSRLARTREGMARGLVAGSVLEDDQLKEQLARAEMDSLMKKDLSMYENELAVLRQELESRQDAAERSEAAIRAREIRAPISGQVLRYEFVLGELVRPETLLYEIFGGEKQILKLRILERHALRVSVGNRYYAWLASYRGLQRVRFRGEVQYLRNVIQSDGQTTYRVAFCSFDPLNHAVPPGTTAEARVYYGKTCLWFFLLGLD